jgi:hypothetical protein
MKVKQVVETKFDSVYIGWRDVQFTDTAGNTINIEITDNQVLELAEVVNAKRDSILEARAEKENEVE